MLNPAGSANLEIIKVQQLVPAISSSKERAEPVMPPCHVRENGAPATRREIPCERPPGTWATERRRCPHML